MQLIWQVMGRVELILWDNGCQAEFYQGITECQTVDLFFNSDTNH